MLFKKMRFFSIVSLILATFCTHASELPADTPEQAVHVLNRLAYGPKAGDVERILRIGINRYIEEQLSPETIAAPPILRAELTEYETIQMDAATLYARHRAPGFGTRKSKVWRDRVFREAVQERVLRAVYHPAQLQEVMVDFWFNHFNIFDSKELTHIWVGAFEREALRPYAMGRFRDLLGATAKHPAMLYYLDNESNAAGKINENYARELLELHTLGVDGGYDQQDVGALARVFTGWTNSRKSKDPAKHGVSAFEFDPGLHSTGEKSLLGRRLTATGQSEGEQAFDMLARDPATARHIAYKLSQYFVADAPPPSLVTTLARKFQDSDGDIRAVLRSLFSSTEFWDPAYRGVKFKTPYWYVVSALRTVGSTPQSAWPAAVAMAQLGMPLYGCPTPDGYKNTRAAWLSPDSLVRRVPVAAAIAGGLSLTDDRRTIRSKVARQINELGRRLGFDTDSWPGAYDPRERYFSLPEPLPRWESVRATLASKWSRDTENTLKQAPESMRLALVLGAPEFMVH